MGKRGYTGPLTVAQLLQEAKARIGQLEAENARLRAELQEVRDRLEKQNIDGWSIK